MLLFWDSAAAVPTGWTDISSTYNNLFPRGDTIANFGTTGGTSNHIPTTSSVTVSATNNNQSSTGGGNGTTLATLGHTHPAPSITNIADATPSSNNNIPAYRTLRLMSYDAGIPNVIPAGGVALFDSTPGVPTDGSWTRLSAQDGKMIRVSTTAGSTGGSDTHNYTLTWSGLGMSSGAVLKNGFLGASNRGVGPHTHAAPAPTTSATMSSLPPYITPLLAKANANTPTISVGFSAMFDGDPGGGWVIRSQSSGSADNTTFYHQYLRPNTAWNGTSQGRDNETLTTATVDTPDANPGFTNLAGLFLTGDGSSPDHTHTLTATFNNSTDVIPPYFGVVVAEKVNFIMSDYRWYEDSGNQDVTDPWSVLNVAQDAPILAIPTAYKPPDLKDQLRLRVRITVNGNNLAAGVAQFKIQYKEGGTDGSCTTGSWTDVDTAGTGTAAWRYGTSTAPGHPNDGDPISTSRLSPASNVMQQFVASSSSSLNPNAVSLGQTTEYDFYLQDNAALGATHYYFRVLESVGTLLSQYDVCPTLSTKPQTGQQLKHGLFFIDGYKGAFSWAD